jgi:hypothetical protein
MIGLNAARWPGSGGVAQLVRPPPSSDVGIRTGVSGWSTAQLLQLVPSASR